MYTDDMKRAFHSVLPPKNFKGVELLDNDNFITVRLDEKNFYSLTYEEKVEAIVYVTKVKKALEDAGAIVLVVRNALS